MNMEQLRDKIVSHFAIEGEWCPMHMCTCGTCDEWRGCEVVELVMDVTGLDATTSPLYTPPPKRVVAASIIVDMGALRALPPSVTPMLDAVMKAYNEGDET